MLNEWRRVLPTFMQWEDTDILTEDINEARLRGKFYGALYIIHRPFLYHALHSPEYQEQLSILRANTDGTMQASLELGAAPPDTLSPELAGMWKEVQEVKTSAKTCIKAAACSTTAFDGIINKSQRLIVTNIFGTAHA